MLFSGFIFCFVIVTLPLQSHDLYFFKPLLPVFVFRWNAGTDKSLFAALYFRTFSHIKYHLDFFPDALLSPIQEHFTEVAQQPDFLNLSFDELTELLQSDHLHVPNEATVFASCLRWFRNATSHCVNESSGPMAPGVEFGSLLTRLLKFVRLQQLPARLLAG